MKKADFNGIAEKYQISPIIARLMRNRDVIGDEAIDFYLNGTVEDLYDVLLMIDMDRAVDILKEKIEEGKKILHQFGSSFDATVKWEFMRNMYISSRIYYFTSYKHVQVDFENTFNFILNRYFSTKLEFKMRYDDSAEPNERGSFLQIKEMLSFGLFFRI